MLYEKHRPRTWDEYVGQDKARDLARRMIERPGFDRGAFWIDAGGDNNSGVGKTTLALLMANQLADDFFIALADGAAVDKSYVRDMDRSAQLTTWGEKRFRVYIVNEAHAITSGAVDALLTFLERLPKHCVVIFTTTRQPDEGLFGSDTGPFASRCIPIRLTNQGLAKAFAERALGKARAEGLDGGKVLEDVVKLVQRCKNNLRATFQQIEAGVLLAV